MDSVNISVFKYLRRLHAYQCTKLDKIDMCCIIKHNGFVLCIQQLIQECFLTKSSPEIMKKSQHQLSVNNELDTTACMALSSGAPFCKQNEIINDPFLSCCIDLILSYPVFTILLPFPTSVNTHNTLPILFKVAADQRICAFDFTWSAPTARLEQR